MYRYYQEYTGIQDRALKDFIGSDSWNFFEILGLDIVNIFNKEGWQTSQQYVDAQEVLKNFRVTNESAERGVKLLADYLGRAKKENIFQSYLQVVERDRKVTPNMRVPQQQNLH